MSNNIIIPEIDVLIASALWLWRKRKVHPYSFSLARGKGIDLNMCRKQLDKALDEADVGELREYVSHGPDIVGFSGTDYWQIECKGSGSGKKQTQRNNFDRALASVVTYYTDTIDDLPKELASMRPYLGLALPNTSHYMHELHSRIRKPLRSVLNLWVLLYDANTKIIRAVSPEAEYE